MRWSGKKQKLTHIEVELHDPVPRADGVGQHPLTDLVISNNFLCWAQRQLGAAFEETIDRLLGFYKSARKFAYFVGVMATLYVFMSLWHIWSAVTVTEQLQNQQQQIERLHQEIEVLRGKINAQHPGAQDKA